MNKATVLFSGGLDSTALISFLLNQKIEVSALHINYGQAANKAEIKAAKTITKYFKITLNILNIKSGLTFSAGDILGRNAFLIFSALTFTNEDKNLIAIAIHSGTKYYDCSEVFFNKAASIVEDYSGGRIKLIAPFLNWSKAEIYVYCKKQSIPIKLTHSCESGDIAPCGMCLSCVDRKAFDVS